MKKIAWILILVPALLVAVFFADLFLRNDLIAHTMTRNLSIALESYGEIEVVETASVCGKLSGNGNGMDFFGVCLVKCQDPEVLKTAAHALEGSFACLDYRRQRDAVVALSYNEHQTVTLDPGYDWEEPYYIFYFCESGHPLSHPLDVRGH